MGVVQSQLDGFNSFDSEKNLSKENGKFANDSSQFARIIPLIENLSEGEGGSGGSLSCSVTQTVMTKYNAFLLPYQVPDSFN